MSSSLERINDIYMIIKSKMKKLFPIIDIDLFENYDYFNTKFDEMSYNKFIEYKFKKNIPYKFTDFNKIDEKERREIPFDYIIEDYNNFIDILDKINPDIFMSNVNLDWKLLQFAKKDTSIHIPPKAPPLPSPPKRSSPKKSKSKLTKEGLEESKSKLKHIQKKLKPDNPDYDLEMAFRNLEK